MFTLLAKLVEILSTYGTRFLEGRTTRGDTAVAAELARCLVLLQDVCVRGRQVLASVEELSAGFGDPVRLEASIAAQVESVKALQELLEERRTLLATVDPELYLRLAPLLNRKSGLLTRWQQQAAQSSFSTTTVFFLSREDLERILSMGPVDGTDSLLVVADTLRELRSRELPDLRRVAPQQRQRLASEVRAAGADLDRAEARCATLLAATERALGPEALGRLRRNLVQGRP